MSHSNNEIDIVKRNVFDRETFLGHGDTKIDSYKRLPTALNIPSLEPRSNYLSSIFYNVVTNVLQKELGFQGFIFIDALNRKVVSRLSTSEQIDLRAFMSENNVLSFPEDVPLVLAVFKKAYQESIFSDSRLALSVKKNLKFK